MELIDLVKQYLRIDFSDDDEILDIFIENAKEYIENMTGKEFDLSSNRHKLLLMVLVNEMYEKREYSTEKAVGGCNYVIKSILMQESLNTEETE